MERTKRKNDISGTPTVNKSDEKVWFHKLGGGSFRLSSGKIIKPNQKFKASPQEIPRAFYDTVRRIDGVDMKKDGNGPVVPIREAAGVAFEIRSKGSAWFDVVNTASGKLVNDKSLRQDEAKALLDQLT